MSSQLEKNFDASKVAQGIQVSSFEKISDLGRAKLLANDMKKTPPKPNDCAIIMYTSGSTGKPKGNANKYMPNQIKYYGSILTLEQEFSPIMNKQTSYFRSDA